MKAFSGYQLIHGETYELDRAFPSSLTTFQAGDLFRDAPNETHFVYCHTGSARLEWHRRTWAVPAGMFAVVPGTLQLSGFANGIVVTRQGYTGLFQIGGPIEQEGRLKYIDGCTDSLIAAPPKKGDPCLNLLYFPPGIDQTAHTHPSDRIGLVLSGRGRCVHGPSGQEPQTTDLVPGMAFCVHANGKHKFQTPYGEPMRVLAYHPDSDHGPSDEEHPMLNRTIVNGVSARLLDEIRTK